MRAYVLACWLVLAGCTTTSSIGELEPGSVEAEDAARARISLGLTYLQNGNFAQAKRNLDRASEFAPRLPQVHFALAFYFQSVGEVERAEEAYRRAMALDPRDADIANSYGAFLCEQGKYEQAEAFFLKAINNNRYASTAETYENLALCATSKGDNAAAIRYFEQALNHQPGRAKTLYLLAELYLENARWEEAATALRRYEKVMPVSPELLHKWWLLYQGKGDEVTALGYSTLLLQRYPEHPLTQAVVAQRQSATPRASVVNKTKALAPVEGQTPAQSPTIHIVEGAENLYRISLKYNIKMASLREWNGLSANATIRPGMKLWLVPPAEQTK